MTGPVLTRRSLLLSAAALAATACAERGASPASDLVWAVGGIDAGPAGPAAATAAMWNDAHPSGAKVSIRASRSRPTSSAG